MDDRAPAVSPQALEANRRLYELRAHLQARRQAGGLSVEPSRSTNENPPWMPREESPLDVAALAVRIEALPAHTGWGSESLTAAIRRGQATARPQDIITDWTALLPPPAESGAEEASDGRHEPLEEAQSEAWVKLYPSIGLGMLRQEKTAAGRLWLLLRNLDRTGQGSVRIVITYAQFTERNSRHYLCSKRHLRNLLRDGEGTFWTRDEERLWLFSAARVANALQVEQLTGRPVALPVEVLLNGIGQFRAHLYAAFHSGRAKDTPQGSQAMPIARSTMARLSGVGASSQRTYETQTAVAVQANFAVGERATRENLENRAWQQGRALFELKDYRGYQGGRKGETYLAWQLPNSYIGEHSHRPKGRQKRINRKLKDLVMKGMPGNVERTSETPMPNKIYYPNGKLAAKAYGRDPHRERFWRRHRTRSGHYVIWRGLK